MSERKITFAELIGTITPLKAQNTDPEFGKQRKIKQSLRIATQNHQPSPQRHYDRITLNYDNLTVQQLWHIQQLRIPLAREIDLHGYFVDDAINRLQDALNERRNRRPEYWLIIHGKGKNSPYYDKAPLKNAIYDTLSQHHAIGALVSIHDKQNESGALVIRVRKMTR